MKPIPQFKEHHMNKRYGLIRALFDLTLIVLSGGLWAVWLVVKYVRTH